MRQTFYEIIRNITPSFAPWYFSCDQLCNSKQQISMCNNIQVIVSNQCRGQWYMQNYWNMYGKDVLSKLGTFVASMLMLT